MTYLIKETTAKARMAYLLRLECEQMFNMRTEIDFSAIDYWQVSRVRGWTAQQVMDYNDRMQRCVDRMKIRAKKVENV